MTERLHDKVALITGSDSGIGQGTAIEFAKEGADVVVHYLEDAEGARQTRQAVEAEDRRAITVQADITDEHAVHKLFDQAVEAFDRVDILMNNAGVDASGDDVADLSTETFDQAMKANLYGAVQPGGHRRPGATRRAGPEHPLSSGRPSPPKSGVWRCSSPPATATT
jgi:glucose 1-dehydrogenase